MELEAAKMIGAGLAAIALAGAGVGIGIIFGNYLIPTTNKVVVVCLLKVKVRPQKVTLMRVKSPMNKLLKVVNQVVRVIREKINMMTMHAAKGLEFDVVFLPGWEEGLFPHQKSIEEKGQNGLEEERRLAYVGITRAKKKAIISFSMNRFYQGDWIDSMASRFIDELPEKHLEKNSFFDEEINNDDDFEFNQDFEIEEGTRSPGWIRYQKRIK